MSNLLSPPPDHYQDGKALHRNPTPGSMADIHKEIQKECYDLTDTGSIRTFGTGATRDTTEGKFDYEGFLSPLVLERYAEYMNTHRKQSDGTLRDSDNWQKGMPLDVYMKSGWRHFMDFWKAHRKLKTEDLMDTILCALMFNVMGYLHEWLKLKEDYISSTEAEDRGG